MSALSFFLQNWTKILPLLIMALVVVLFFSLKGFTCLSKVFTSEDHGEIHEINVPKPSDYDRARVPKPGAESQSRAK